MSYNTILDTWFSYPWLSYGIPFVAFSILVYFRDRLSQNKEWKWLIWNLYYAVPVLLIFTAALFNPLWLGYGGPAGVEEVRFMQQELYVMDYIGSAGSRYGGGEIQYRIHVLDPVKGTKKVRFIVGSDARLIGVQSDCVAVARGGGVGYYSNSNGRLLVEFNKQTLPSLFPELSAGVDRFMWGDGRKIMEITAMDGKEWNLHTISRRLLPATVHVDNDLAQTRQLFIKENDIRVNDKAFGSDYIKMEGKGGNQNLRYVKNGRDSLLNEGPFLSGHPVAIDPEGQTFVILHYETTARQRCLLTCLSFTGKKVWEVKQASLSPSYFFREGEAPGVGSDESRARLFISIGDEILCLRMKDGGVEWRQGL